MKKLLLKLWAKITAILLLTVLALTFLASAIGIGVLVDQDAYLDGGETLRAQALAPAFWKEMGCARDYYEAVLLDSSSGSVPKTDPEAYAPENSNFYFTVTDPDSGEELLRVGWTETDSGSEPYFSEQATYSVGQETERHEKPFFLTRSSFSDIYKELDLREKELTDAGWDFVEVEQEEWSTENVDSHETVHVSGKLIYGKLTEQRFTVTGYVRREMAANDALSRMVTLIELLLRWKYGLIAAAAATFLLCLLLFIWLLCSAGHREGTEGIRLTFVDRIPYDLFLALILGIIGCEFRIAEEVGTLGIITFVFILTMLAAIAFLFLLLFFMSTASRIKSKNLFKNTIIYYCLLLLKKVLCKLSGFLRYLAVHIPLYWKAILLWGGLCLVELLLGSLSHPDTCWLIEKVILTALLAAAVIAMQKIKKGGQALADGDFDSQIDTKYSFGEFRRHAENLNAVGSGMQKALAQQMKAERFKTELITNVSHDIKTPLTSIVNYVDLLKKEPMESEKAKEYIDVLDRQSARLKKLTEDLVEASKASTGALNVSMEPTDINVLLGQVTGEYLDRMQKAELEPVLRLSPDAPCVMADGRLLWRVFDNLCSNICKYSLPGTRVYFESSCEGGTVKVSFKNISRYALNISPEELMERFVRGDSARSTEGSGLGLSIARSLTELQKGHLELSVDGDLFKVTVTFVQLQ